MNKYEWWWDAKKRQLTDDTKIGDLINVGYISDCHKHNYESAKIIWINKVRKSNGEIFFQTTVQFENGDTIQW